MDTDGAVKIEFATAEKPKRKIAIIGTAESIGEAPYDDTTWEIWGLGVDLTYPQFKRYDRLYEMHDKGYWINEEIMKRLNGVKCTIWMQDVYPEIPNSKKYPLEEISAGYHKNYTSSIAFMLAHAALEAKTLGNIGQVHMYGVHMMADEEYGYQRPACEYWLGILEGLGVKTHVAGTGSVLKCTYVYGYDKEWKMISDLGIRKQQLMNGLKELEGRLEKTKSEYLQQQGAIKDVDWTIRRIQ